MCIYRGFFVLHSVLLAMMLCLLRFAHENGLDYQACFTSLAATFIVAGFWVENVVILCVKSTDALRRELNRSSPDE
jgi:hypothetical protein